MIQMTWGKIAKNFGLGKGLFRFVSILPLTIFLLSGCGDNRTNVSFTLTFDNNAKTAVYNNPNAQAAPTMRVMYSFAALGTGVHVDPASAVPGPGATANTFDWSTAAGLGASITGNQVTINDIPLGQLQTQIMVEFLVEYPDHVYHPVAFYCYTPTNPNIPLVSGQLVADASVSHAVQLGRTCSSCNTIQTYTIGQLNTFPLTATCP